MFPVVWKNKWHIKYIKNLHHFLSHFDSSESNVFFMITIHDVAVATEVMTAITTLSEIYPESC